MQIHPELDRRNWRFDRSAYRRSVWRAILPWRALGFVSAGIVVIISLTGIAVAFS